MSHDLFAGLPPLEPDRWLVSMAPFEDGQGQHFRLTIECRLAATSWQARIKRALMAIGMRQAAERRHLGLRIEIELFAIQPIHGDLVGRDGAVPESLFTPMPPRILQLELETTPAQGVVYHMLRMRTDKGEASFPSFETGVKCELFA